MTQKQIEDLRIQIEQLRIITNILHADNQVLAERVKRLEERDRHSPALEENINLKHSTDRLEIKQRE